MTKEQLKIYITEAIDAMDHAELEQLFPQRNQPDLYTLAQEFTGLKGSIKKLAQSSLKVHHEVQNVISENSGRWEKMAVFFEKEQAEQERKTSKEIDEDLKTILFQLIDQDDIISNTHNNYKELLELRLLNINEYKKQLAAWQKGFDIMEERWSQFIKNSGLYKTGKVGQTFDPQFHEAVLVEHHPDKPNNIILETEVLGFLFRNRIVRQAKVVVNKTDPQETIEPIRRSPGKGKKRKAKRKKRR